MNSRKPMLFFSLIPLKRRENSTSLGTFLTIIFLVFLGFQGCKAKEAEQAPQQGETDLTPNRIVCIGRIEPEQKFLELKAETTGIVTGLFFKQGGQIKGGEIILQLSNDIEKAKLEQVDARLLTQQSQIRSSQAALAQAQILLKNTEKTYARYKSLFEQNAEAQAGYDQAKTEYESLVEGTNRLEADLSTARNFLQELKANRKLAQAELDRKIVRAPSDGQLLSLDITLGSPLSPDTAIGMFAPEGPKIARGEIDEMFADKVELGLRGYIRPQGETTKLADGSVTFVGPYLRKKSLFSDDVGDLEDRRVREVWITLDSGEELLFGARVECVILLK